MNTFSQNLTSKLQTKFSNLVFKRVGKVCLNGNDQIDVTFHHSPTASDVYTTAEAVNANFTDKQIEKNVEYRYKKFSGFDTSSTFFNSRNYAEIDFGSDDCLPTFNFVKKTTNVPPRVGDLICGLVELDNERKTYYYKYWFICSEQFLHLCNLLFSEEPQTLKEFDRVMSGNRLMSNTYRKWSLSSANFLKSLSLDNEERMERFYHLRHETIAKKYVHVYAAIAMICRYSERPNENNVPNNKNLQPEDKITKWDLPENYITHLEMYANNVDISSIYYFETEDFDTYFEIDFEKL